MEKPFVVCHMFVSMDGKIDGAFMGHPAAVPARDEYGNLRGFYRCDATLYGAVTMAGGFADGWEPHVPHSPVHYPKEDWLAPSEVKNYIISVDPKGELAWSSAYIEKKGRPKAHAVEVLTGQVSEDYLSYLRGFLPFCWGETAGLRPAALQAENQAGHRKADAGWGWVCQRLLFSRGAHRRGEPSHRPSGGREYSVRFRL